MSRQTYLDLAAAGLAMPIGTDLVLAEQTEPEAVLLDGKALGQVVVDAARRYRSPLAIPLMDLRVEKEAIGLALGHEQQGIETMHLTEALSDQQITDVVQHITSKPTQRMQATADAIAVVAETYLEPIGMCIGPFSLMVKLVEEPILPVYLAASGATSEDDPEVARLFSLLELATQVILAYIRLQIQAGAKAMFICEPAANVVYLSPNQLASDAGGRPDIFDRCVMAYNQRIIDELARHDVDLIFHDCGELNDDMVRRIGWELRPALLSLGSSRQLWHDAKLIPDDVVLFGNLPSKQFYSDGEMAVQHVQRRSQELLDKMKETGQPFILGSECDVLHVEGSSTTIRSKVDVICSHSCLAHTHNK